MSRSLLVACSVAVCLIPFAAGCKGRRTVEVVAGKDNTCLRTEDGRVYCWGDDVYMQTKRPELASQPGTRTIPKRVNGIQGARSLTLAASHGCVAKESGGLGCFLDSDLDASDIASVDAKLVSASTTGVCALTGAGELRCFRTNEPRTLPRTVVEVPKGISGARAVAAGERHVCVLDGEGKVACFGDSSYGQLGTANKGQDQPNTLLTVQGVQDAIGLAAGKAHTCALLRSGRVACWGANEIGQIARPVGGMHDLAYATVAEVDGVEGATSVGAAYHHTCAVVGGGAVKCWGSNFYGESGAAPSKTAQFKPVTVEGVTDAVQVTCGDQHSCALTKTGALKCWGRNHRGQLGNGTNTDSWRAVDVKMP